MLRREASGVLLLPLIVLCSCTGLEPAAIGAGASAAEAGVTFLSRGKLSSLELVGHHNAVEALRRAAATLGLAIREELVTEARARLVFEDDLGERIVVVVFPRTASITQIKSDVGMFGERGLGSLLLMQTLAELTKMDAYIARWDRTDPRRPVAPEAGHDASDAPE